MTRTEKELTEVRERLAVAEQTLNAIYTQEVDALVVAGPDGDQIFTLKAAETPYRLLVEAMNEGTLIALPDGMILHCNRRFSEMVRLPMEKITGASWQPFFKADEQEAVASLMQHAGEYGAKGEFTMQAADGSPLPVHLSVRALKLDGVESLAVIVTDIAELRKAHQALNTANEQLETRVQKRTGELAKANEVLRVEIAEHQATERALAEAEAKVRAYAGDLEQRIRERTADLRAKVAELEIFSYSVSHDLRAPLRAIQSFSQILLEECGPTLSADHAGYLRRVIAGAQHLDQLIQEVLIYSRTARGKLSFSHVQLDTLVRDTIQSYSMFQPPAAEIVIEQPLPTVVAHEAMLTQCVSNLLGNAVKFVAPKTIPRVRIRPETMGKHARVWFEDNGIGVDPADHERIFNLFERVHANNDYPGTGIGLSIVKKAIERMGGSVGVESKPGHGSRFYIQLPLASDV
ncbi:MAG TPA: ATP-binding protein [Verrucomicrobiae bacterium]|nr:ATP-binding protein [Verrucomicrobiae bacterium]